MTDYRMEHDSLGEVRVPAAAYYGPQTQRAVENFSASGHTLPKELIHALGLVKWAAAKVNHGLGKLTAGSRPLSGPQVEALVTAAREVADGRFDDQFPVDIYQTGSGTSTNMNANEVIANRAIELSGGDRVGQASSLAQGSAASGPAQGQAGTLVLQKAIHPNDHVNMGQSTNDTFPTAIHVAVAVAIQRELIPALRACGGALAEKAAAWQQILKIGRTHLIDATPLALGQEIGGMARQLDRSVGRAGLALEAVLELPVGGTAVGSGINTHREFARRMCELLSKETGLSFTEAADHFEANAQRDGLVECHGQLRTIATTLFTVANNIRWLSSGPQTGYHEIALPDLQPGSSIMPGKVNPVMSESLMQAAARVLGNDTTLAFCGAAGSQFQLNVMMPLMGEAVLESVRILAGATAAFTRLCLTGMTANAAVCEAEVERSPAMATGLNPYLGYEQAAKLARESLATGKTVRELVREKGLLPEDVLEKALDPWRMVRPGE